MSVTAPASIERYSSSWVASALLAAALTAACGGSSGSGGQSGVPGQEGLKPGGVPMQGPWLFVDENQSGSASNLSLAETRWGRLVDIHEVDAGGMRVEDPVFADFVIEPTILTNGSQYVLDRDPVTQRERLTIQATKRGVMDSSAFDGLLAAANDALPTVGIKDVNSSPPFARVPRNSCLVLRFGDCLKSDAAATLTLSNTVKVFTGYPPTTPFTARVVFDPNHGAVVRGDFFPTRVLVDMTTSLSEAGGLPVPQDVNAVGLPARSASDSANVSVRIPSRVDVGSGQPVVITNVSGSPLDSSANGPVDGAAPTLDVLRAMRSGNSSDDNNGFLEDEVRPRVVSFWPMSITAAADDGAGTSGFDFVTDMTFASICLNAPALGDVVMVNGLLLQVTEAAVLAGSDVVGLKLRSTSEVANALGLLGQGQYQTPFHPSIALTSGCWVSFLPEPETFPATGVSTTAQMVVRFSEPMDPDTLSPFGGFLVVSGASGGSSTVRTGNLVVGEVRPNGELTGFSFDPNSPYPHMLAVADPLHLELGEALDLAGNSLSHTLPFVDFTLSTLEATEQNASIVLRFGSADEYAPNGGLPDGFRDLRGQFFYDSVRGSIIPRPVAVSGWPVDGTVPVPGNMAVLTNGISTPLNPLGAKLQTVWRHCDVGWNVRDETKYNLDVLGLSWAPAAGQVVADFFDGFEIRLGHSRFLPDEVFDPIAGVALYPASGLPPGPNTFEGNYLAGSNPMVVHNRALGYTVNPSNLFTATSGTRMIPYPLNRGFGPTTTYTWRDTSILSKGADGDAGQPGIPTGIETTLGVAGGGPLAGFRNVPSFGLPLLIEFSCFPSDAGLGINGINVALATPITVPNFRAYSAGGINNLGNPVLVLPDSETFPKGGFNPFSTPPGLRTSGTADNVFYQGQLDTVVRVSRVHSVWLDSGVTGVPLWGAPLMEPSPAGQPLGAGVVLDFRSATSFTGGGVAPFNALAMNVYGDQTANAPQSLTGWSNVPSVGDGQRFLQVRMTFLNNISTGLGAELKALALPYDIQ